MEPVRNSKNPAVVEAARLHRARERHSTRKTLIEGPHLLEEAVKGAADIRQIFVLASDAEGQELARHLGIDPVLVDEQALKRLAGTETPRGPIAVAAIPKPVDLPQQNLLVSWGVSDPGNVGTMIRIAHAFGWGFGYAEGTADPWSPKVLRSGAGSQFATGVHFISDFGQLSGRGFGTIATVVRGGEEPSALDDNAWFAVLVGEEASGLPDGIVSMCDRSLTIPMPGRAESLNAAVASGILLYALSARGG